MLHWTAPTLADFLVAMDKVKPQLVKSCSEAINVTYAMAFELKAPVTGGTVMAAIRRNARIKTQRVRLPAEEAIDPGTITKYWASRPTNSELSMTELRLKVISLTRLFWGARAADLYNLPSQSVVSTPRNLRGRELGYATSVRVSYYDSKTGRSTVALKNHKWSKSFDVYPLTNVDMMRLHGWTTERAKDFVIKVCPVRAFGELEHRVEELLQLKFAVNPSGPFLVSRTNGKVGVNLGNRRVGAESCLPTLEALAPDQPMAWISSATINNRLKDWYNAEISPTSSKSCGSKQDFVPSEFRHFCARSLETVGCTKERMARLTQESPAEMWAQSYGAVPENADFRSRWDAVDQSIQASLNADARMCV